MSKIWIPVATVLIVVGLLVFAGAMIASDFDFTRFSTVKYETNTYEVSEAFTEIEIDADATEIELVPSENGQCKIVCYEKEKAKHSAAVKDGRLTIGTSDTRKWYDHIGFFFGEAKMTVYLPGSEYASLHIKGSTGDIEIPRDFSFGSVDISASTGDVVCRASVSEGMKIKLSTGSVRVEELSVGALDLSVTTGRVTVSSVNCKGDMKVSVSTGKTKLTDISCKGFVSSGSTGDISLKNLIAAGSLSIERSTGDVVFDGSDAAEIYVRTSTGSVKGTLLSEKVFITETSTGSVSLPKTVTGGKCEIRTHTGDIQIEIQ